MMLLFVTLLAAMAVTTAYGTSATPSGKYDFQSSIQSQASYGIDYERFLGEGSQLPDTLKHALQTYQKVETLPSCNKVATSTLLHSCASIDSTAAGDDIPGSAGSIDSVKSIYATRLAICELTEVNAPIPAACSAFVLTTGNTKKKGFLGRLMSEGPSKPTVTYPVYEAATEQDLEACRTALAKTPQSWTSYSNSKQNAATYCHAVRGDIEKDEQLHLFKVLAETTVDVDSSLRDAVQKIHDADAAFHELTTNIKQFSLDLAETEDRKNEVRELWSNAMGEWHRQIETFEQGFSRIQDQVQQTGIKIFNSGEQATSTISRLVSMVNERTEPITKQLALISTDSDTLHNKLQFANELLQQNVLQSLYAVAGSLDVMSTNSADMQLALDDHAPIVARLVEDTVALAAYMQDMPSKAADVEHALENMKEDVDDASASASKIRTDIEAANASFKEFLGPFAALFQLPTMTRCAFLLIVAITVVKTIPGASCAVHGGIDLLRPYALYLLALSAASIYLAYYESPSALLLRCKEGNVTADELACVIVICGSLVIAVAVNGVKHCTSHSARQHIMLTDEGEVLLQRKNTEKHGFWFNDPKAYAARNSAGRWTV